MSQERVNNTRRNFIKTAAAATVAATIAGAVAAEAADTSEEYAVALRVRELAEAEEEREGDGWNFLITYVDDVTTNGSDQLCPNPDSEFFVPVFVKAVRELGRNFRPYVELKDLIARVDAGADLAELAEEKEAGHARREEERAADFLDSPEPEDKTSRDWRIWKLRQFERGFYHHGGDAELYGEAWREYKGLLGGLLTAPAFWHVSHATALLPQLLITRQEIDALDAEWAGDEEGGAK